MNDHTVRLPAAAGGDHDYPAGGRGRRTDVAGSEGARPRAVPGHDHHRQRKPPSGRGRRRRPRGDHGAGASHADRSAERSAGAGLTQLTTEGRSFDVAHTHTAKAGVLGRMAARRAARAANRPHLSWLPVPRVPVERPARCLHCHRAAAWPHHRRGVVRRNRGSGRGSPAEAGCARADPYHRGGRGRHGGSGTARAHAGSQRPCAPCSRRPRRGDRRRCRRPARLPEGTRGFPGHDRSPQPGRRRRRLGRRRRTGRASAAWLGRKQPGASSWPANGRMCRRYCRPSTYSCCQAVTRGCPRR